MTLDNLNKALQCSWSIKTSYCPKAWSKANPAAGQCLVTSLIVQDYFGGKLIHGTVGRTSHWWNALPEGEVVDLTLQQFGGKIAVEDSRGTCARKRVMRIASVRSRYELLRETLQPLLMRETS